MVGEKIIAQKAADCQQRRQNCVAARCPAAAMRVLSDIATAAYPNTVKSFKDTCTGEQSFFLTS